MRFVYVRCNLTMVRALKVHVEVKVMQTQSSKRFTKRLLFASDCISESQSSLIGTIFLTRQVIAATREYLLLIVTRNFSSSVRHIPVHFVVALSSATRLERAQRRLPATF
jgi:hypothetical protein